MAKIILMLFIVSAGIGCYIFGGLGTMLIFAVFGPFSVLGPIGNTPTILIGPFLRLGIGYSFFYNSFLKPIVKMSAKDPKNSVGLEQLKSFVKKIMIIMFILDFLFVLSLLFFSSSS